MAAANEQPPAAPDKAALNRVMKPIVWRVPAMDQVVVQTNLTYSSANDPILRMDVYAPPGMKSGERRPVVLLVHGGVPAALPVKDMGAYRSWGRLIAAHGMIAVTFNHRLRWPLAQLPEAADDVRTAIDFARANAAKFNIDADRMCIGAFSAGGPLLTVALQDERRYVRCQLAIYPLIDVQGFGAPNAERFSLGTYAGRPSFVPLFVARAGRDAIPTLNERLDRFITGAIAANAPITFMNHPEGVHGFDIDNDDERSREIIRAAVEFMRTHLSPP